MDAGLQTTPGTPANGLPCGVQQQIWPHEQLDMQNAAELLLAGLAARKFKQG
jgi:hypothetical protein